MPRGKCKRQCHIRLRLSNLPVLTITVIRHVLVKPLVSVAVATMFDVPRFMKATLFGLLGNTVAPVERYVVVTAPQLSVADVTWKLTGALVVPHCTS